MKTLYLYGARDLRFGEEPMPQPREGEALVRVTAVGLCGSDLHWYSFAENGSAHLDGPIILGHEFAGIVESGPLAGQHVAVDPAIPCGRCEFCKAGQEHLCPEMRFPGNANFGALTEFVIWPESNLVPLPPGLDDTDGAMLEPFGVALHTLDLCVIRPGMTVGIYGCGPVGLLLVQLVRLSGAARIFATDRLPHRLEAARGYGATDTFLADLSERQAIREATHRRGVDVAIEVAGDLEAVATATETCKPGGTVVLIGIAKGDVTAFPATEARHKELNIRLQHRMNLTYPRTIDMARRGMVDLKSIVSHRFPFQSSVQAFELAERREGLKVVIDVNQ
jgi:L-iditol 2-dehydrogenase